MDLRPRSGRISKSQQAYIVHVSAERVAAIRVALWQDTLPRTGSGGTFATELCASTEVNFPHEEKAADVPNRMFAVFLHCAITFWGNHPCG